MITGPPESLVPLAELLEEGFPAEGALGAGAVTVPEPAPTGVDEPLDDVPAGVEF